MRKTVVFLLIVILLITATGCTTPNKAGKDITPNPTEVKQTDNTAAKPPADNSSLKGSSEQNKIIAEVGETLKDLEKLLNELDETEESDYIEEGTN